MSVSAGVAVVAAAILAFGAAIGFLLFLLAVAVVAALLTLNALLVLLTLTGIIASLLTAALLAALTALLVLLALADILLLLTAILLDASSVGIALLTAPLVTLLGLPAAILTGTALLGLTIFLLICHDQSPWVGCQRDARRRRVVPLPWDRLPIIFDDLNVSYEPGRPPVLQS